jgi:DNA processing protein
MPQWEAHQQARQIVPPDPREAQLLAYISHEPSHIDDIVRQSTLPAPQVSMLLTLLELKGLVRQSGPMSYVKMSNL